MKTFIQRSSPASNVLLGGGVLPSHVLNYLVPLCGVKLLILVVILRLFHQHFGRAESVQCPYDTMRSCNPSGSHHASKMESHLLIAKYSRNTFYFVIKSGTFCLLNQVQLMPPSSLGKIKHTVGKCSSSSKMIRVPLNTILPLQKVVCLPHHPDVH